MKRRVKIFIYAVLALMAIGPAVNLMSAPSLHNVKWWRKSFLYNVDFASRWAGLLLYPLGISTDPAQVIIGRDDWLYLGDKHDRTLTVDRHTQTPLDAEHSRKIGEGLKAWDSYMTSKGVKLFRVMIGPNKGSIYPEHMPAWAHPVSPGATDTLMAETKGHFHIDLRPALLEAKSKEKLPLYYKTDTHWNRRGSSIAFRSFAQEISKVAPDIVWPSDETYKVMRLDPRPGGDLANFLRISSKFTDPEPIPGVLTQGLKTTRLDLDTGRVVEHGNDLDVASPETPLLVKSEHALNQKKVLWLRDSFGTTMAPYMAATFSETLQLHWAHAFVQGGQLMRLIDQWKPDYVFVTVVERAAQNDVFAAYPPPAVIPGQTEYKPTQLLVPFEFNQIGFDRIRNRFQINGGDPFIDFSLAASAAAADTRFLRLELKCDDGSATVPLQVFWLGEGQSYFDEAHSARLTAHAGQQLIDLHALRGWLQAGTVQRLRLDIDAGNACRVFTLGVQSVGTGQVRTGTPSAPPQGAQHLSARPG